MLATRKETKTNHRDFLYNLCVYVIRIAHLTTFHTYLSFNNGKRIKFNKHLKQLISL